MRESPPRFRWLAGALAAFLVLPLAAWARHAPPPNPIDPPTRSGLFVKDVVVDWQVDDAKGAADPQYQSNKAEMTKALTDAVRSQFQYSPYGPDAVELDIAVRSFHRYEVIGDVSVVRLADHKLLGKYEKLDGYFIGVVDRGGLLGAVIGLTSVPDPTPGAAACFAAVLRARFNDLSEPQCGKL